MKKIPGVATPESTGFLSVNQVVDPVTGLISQKVTEIDPNHRSGDLKVVQKVESVLPQKRLFLPKPGNSATQQLEELLKSHH